MQRILKWRHGGTLLFLFLFVAIASFTRLLLLFTAFRRAYWNLPDLVGVFSVGAFYDFVAASYFAIPVVLYLTFIPDRFFTSRAQRYLAYAFYFALLWFLVICGSAEFLYWHSFHHRFDHTAWQYLLNFRTVLTAGPVTKPSPWLLGGLFCLSAALFVLLLRLRWITRWLDIPESGRFGRYFGGFVFIALPVAFTFLVSNTMVPPFGNAVNRSLAQDGLYSLGGAIKQDLMASGGDFPTINRDQALAEMKAELSGPNTTFSANKANRLARNVAGDMSELHYNVVIVVIPNLQPGDLGASGDSQNLTPNLDRLEGEGLNFENCYATGSSRSRTLEAILLGLPASSRSAVVTSGTGESLYNLAGLFQGRGYATQFLFGGFAAFDHLDRFFTANKFTVIDRTTAEPSPVNPTNAWGITDEDLYARALASAEKAAADKKPFLQLIVTTSTHRPFAIPAGKIGATKGSTRNATLQYADFALGQYISKAQGRPWFGHTIFVITGIPPRTPAIPSPRTPDDFRVPLFVINSTLIPPARIDKLCSQIDIGSTLLALMHWTYQDRSFGHDILTATANQSRATWIDGDNFAWLAKDKMTLLGPQEQSFLFNYNSDYDALFRIQTDKKALVPAIAAHQMSTLYIEERGEISGADEKAPQPHHDAN